MTIAVRVINNISAKGLKRFPAASYQVENSSEVDGADVILLRSTRLHETTFPQNLLAVGRAGAGTNNIPIGKLSKLGVPVFNTPGANANSVKELVIAGMLLASRHIGDAWAYTKKLEGDEASISQQVEAGKKQFAGSELLGKRLGVIGLGSIGRMVANIGVELGMEVIGFDPGLTVDGAWKLSSKVKQAKKLNSLLSQVDFLTLHVPLIDATRDMINAKTLGLLPEGATLLNFARNGIVDDRAARAALESGHVAAYVTDFPNSTLAQVEGVIALPHLGASTHEAEENCATMIVDQVRDYVENGNITNSVNFPEVSMVRNTCCRVAVCNSNQPNVLGQISSCLAENGINISDMVNQSREDVAYTIVDTDSVVDDDVFAKICAIEGVLNARVLRNGN